MVTLMWTYQLPHQPAPTPQVIAPPPPNSGSCLTISEKAFLTSLSRGLQRPPTPRQPAHSGWKMKSMVCSLFLL